ncbi:hypothetical protein AB0J82_20880 [Asanoa sp. NPDC049518]|uniref:hypothetical protein n=1 Tax=unclassified Asanoa TaxID=2685164 RepID=UPI00342E9ACA
MTLAIATYAAIVSTCSLVVAFFAYRQGGPRVDAKAACDPRNPTMHVAVFNKGRGATTIARVEALAYIPQTEKTTGWWRGYSDDELHHRLEGHSSVTVDIELVHDQFARPVSADESPSTARGTGYAIVMLSDGRVLYRRAKIERDFLFPARKVITPQPNP